MSTNDAPLPESDKQQLDALRECGQLFFQRGWSVGTSSNYSVVSSRDPLRLWVTVSGKDKGRLNQDDFVLVDDQGKPVDSNAKKSSAETLLHVVAVRNPETNCVLHTHSVWSTLLSDWFHDQRGFWITGYEMLKGLEGVRTHEHQEWVDIFDNTQHIPDLAQEFEARLNDDQKPPMHGFLIHHHGLYTWGANVDEARRHIEIFEFLFECIGRRLSMHSEKR